MADGTLTFSTLDVYGGQVEAVRVDGSVVTTYTPTAVDRVTYDIVAYGIRNPGNVFRAQNVTPKQRDNNQTEIVPPEPCSACVVFLTACETGEPRVVDLWVKERTYYEDC